MSQRIVLALDSHLLSYFQACPMKFWLIYAEHLRTKKEKKAYDIGTLIHEALRRVNRAKLHKRFKFTDVQLLEIGYRCLRRSKVLWIFNGNGRKDEAKSKENLLFHISKFTEFYAWRKGQERFFRPVGREVGFSKILYEDKYVIFIYEGRIDEIIRVENETKRNSFLSWVDYKTQSRDYSIYTNRNQFIGYSWAIGTNMGFICYYGLQKEKQDPHKYKTIFHSSGLIRQWRRDTIHTYREIVARVPFGIKEFPRCRHACDASAFGTCQFVPLCDNEWAGCEVQNGIKRQLYKIEEWKPW